MLYRSEMEKPQYQTFYYIHLIIQTSVLISVLNDLYRQCGILNVSSSM